MSIIGNTIRVFAVTTGLLAVACQPPTPRVEAPRLLLGARTLDYEVNARVLDLENGVRVLVAPDAKTNLMKIDVRYRVGAAEDPDGKSGLAHLVEHLLFEIPSSGPKSPTIAQYLGSLALYHNAYTLWDETHYMIVAPAKLRDPMLMLEARRLSARCEHIDQAIFEREREVVRNEIRQRMGVGSHLRDFLHQDIYGEGHAYARSIGGTDREIAAITRQDVCDFIDRHYTPSSAIVVVSGRVDLEQTLASLKRFFGRIPAKKAAPRKKITRVDLRGSRSEHRLAVEEATALISFRAPVFTDIRLVRDKLDRQLMEGRLSKLLVKHDYITDIAVIRTGGVRLPLTTIAISVDQPERLEKVVSMVFDELSEIAKDLDPRRLSSMIEDERAALLLAIEPFMAQSMALADYLQYTDHVNFIYPQLSEYSAVVADELRGYAQNTFVRERSHIMLVYPDEDARPEELRAPLTFTPKKADDWHDWKHSLNLGEAERDLTIDMKGIDTLVREFELGNGMRVFLAPSLGYPVVDIRLVLPGGNLHEPESMPGLADIAATLMEPGKFRFKGALDQWAARMMFDAVMSMGGEVHGSADARSTTLRIAGMSMYVDGLLWQLYWQARTGSYNKKTLQHWRSLMTRGTITPEDHAKERRTRAFMGALFGPTHPSVTRPPMRELAGRIKREDLQRFHERNHKTRGATLIITGEFPVEFVESEVRRLFGSLPAGTAPAPRPEPEDQREPGARYLGFVDDKAVQTEIIIAFSTPARGRSDMAQRNVLDEMIQAEMSSLREQLGATYGVQVSYSNSDGSGVVLIGASVDRDRSDKAYQAMLQVLDDIRSGKSVAAFVRARRQVMRGLLADNLHSRSVADGLQAFATSGLSSAYWREQAEVVSRLRMADILPVAARDLAVERSAVLIQGTRAVIDVAYMSTGNSGYEMIE